MTTTFETAKVGDKVWHLEYGWGEVEHIEKRRRSIIVSFLIEEYCDMKSFTYTGKLCSCTCASTIQTLFWDEVEIVAPHKPLPDFPADTKLFVWGKEGGKKIPRYFSHFDENGRVVCYGHGQSSWTSNGTVVTWTRWELAE